MSIADDVFSESDQQIIKVPTPEWPKVDGKIFARSMSALELDRYQQTLRRAKEEKLFYNSRAVLVQLGTVDEAGQPVFGSEHVGMLANRNAGVIDRIWNAIWKASGQDEEDKKAAVKNLEETPGDDSQSD